MSTKLAPALRPDWSRAPHRPGLSADGCRRTVDPPTMRFKRQLVAAGGNGLGLIEPFARTLQSSACRPEASHADVRAIVARLSAQLHGPLNQAGPAAQPARRADLPKA